MFSFTFGAIFGATLGVVLMALIIGGGDDND